MAVPVGTAAAAGPQACAGWQVVPSPGPGQSGLHSVSAVSATDAWAVGDYLNDSGHYRTLTEHWNGHTWQVVPSPNPAGGASPTDTLAGVVALSAKNVWAAGFYEKTTTSFRTLAEHWNGTKWSVVATPNAGTGENTLGAVAASGPADVWAAGYRQATADAPRRTLIEHWNGTKWAITPSPNVGRGDNFAFGVAAVPATGAWAVGSDPVSFTSTLAMHWNGSAWSVTPTVNPGQGDRFLNSVTAPTAGFALAVGSDLNGSQTQTLTERWNGSAWSLVPSPSPGQDYNSLQSAAATSPSNGWAVGVQRTKPGARFRTLAERWNGSTWTVVSIPSPGQADDWLYSVAAVPGHGGFWAVGSAGGATLTEFHC
jgi:hypothetical protein